MEQFFKRLFMAVGIGLISGMIVLFFSSAIDAGVVLMNAHVLSKPLGLLWMPIIGGFLIILLNKLYVKDDHSGIGIVQILMELEFIKTHFMRPFRVLTRVISATISLIFGFSVGRFGPIVHLGSAIGSNIGYYFKMSADDVRILIGCGASAAIAVVFKTPLFGAVFVLEVLFRKQYAQFFAPVVIASIVGHQIGQALNPMTSPFLVAELMPFNANDVFLYAGLGMFLSILGMLYMSSIDLASFYFAKMPNKNMRLILASVLIGGIALAFPLNMELHHQTTIQAMLGRFGVTTLMGIIIFKIVGTGISLGSGFIGGNFYPGVTIGAAFGMLYNKWLYPTQYIPAFGVLGVGGMISGYLNAPISGIVFIVEASQNLSLMVPALVVCSISSMAVNHIFKRDIFTKPYERLLNERLKNE